MNRYVVRYYVGTLWSFFTQADHFEECTFESADSLEEFAVDLAEFGFAESDDKWIMPGAILSVRKLK